MREIVAVLIVASSIATAGAVEEKKHPPQVLRIAKELKALLASEKDAFLTLSEGDTDKTVQVAKVTVDGKTHLSLNIAHYPSEDKPEKALPAAGVKIRDSWQQEGFEPQVYVQYSVPREDAKYLSYSIHRIFLNFFNSTADYVLVAGVEVIEDDTVDFDPDDVSIEVTAGDLPQADSSDVNGNIITFPGLRSMTKLNGEITDLRTGNMDADMKQYAVVLDDKGREFGAAQGVAYQVTGQVKIVDGKRMLMIKDFKKHTNQ